MSKTGNFDLNFPGARIYCNTPEKRGSILSFLNGEKKKVEIPLLHSDMEDDLQRAIFNTTYNHEGKHLHDHLICPQLLHNIVLKLSSVYYASLAIYEWNNGNRPYKYIPTPFTNWIELPQEKKEELLEDDDISPSDVPMYSLQDAHKVLVGEMECDDNFTKSILLAALHYNKYRYNLRQYAYDGYNTELSIKAFTESSAFVQQSTEIALKYGEYGNELAGMIRQKSFQYFQELGKKQREKNIQIMPEDYIGYSIYTSAFTMIWRFLYQSKVKDEYWYQFISYVLFWALSGNVLEGSKESNFPRNRLERLFNLDYMGIDLELNKDSNIKELFNNPLETFKKWDYFIITAYAGQTILSISQGKAFKLDSNSTPIDFNRFFERLLGNIANMIQYAGSIGLVKVANYLYNVANSSFYMKNLFLKDPNCFLQPVSYSNNICNFVNIPFCIEFDNVAPIREEEINEKSNKFGFQHNSVFGESLNKLYSNKQIPLLDWKLYVEAKDYIDFSECLFGVPTLDRPSEIIKQYLPNINPWFI